MAIIKCKMCGGDLEVTTGTSVAECEYCGTKQTLPKVNDEVIQNLFNRANNLRIKCEFDKAEQIYEKILQENDAEAEAHWGIVLCKYGIEYVEDPKSFQRIPTCHRTSYDAVTTDADYLAAVEHADAAQKSIYEAEAKAIDEIQKNILNIVKNEKPFDVFICYKETDENGKRTIDSAIANDIYYQLTQEGMKVFYAAITLEDKLGQEYEPCIFAALNSAKVMLVIGTKPQHFTAVWVKNEWSRFLKLMKSDRSKLLIPCYRDMDAYDLPEEFAHLQAQDMSKIGFINDVVRGIKKVAVKEEPKATVVKETVIAGGNANTAPLLKRAFMFLEDGDWNSANEYCEKVLDIDPENAQAYLGKLMAELKVKKQDDLKNQAEPFDGKNNYQKVLRFADDDLKATIVGYIDHINTRNEIDRQESIYVHATTVLSKAEAEKEFNDAADLFASIASYKDAAAQAENCKEQAKIAHKYKIYYLAKDLMLSSVQTNIENAAMLFSEISGWRDADELKAQCPALAETARNNAIYTLACHKMQGSYTWGLGQVPCEESYRAAIEEFEKIKDWKDAEEKIRLCLEKIDELNAQKLANQKREEEERIVREKRAEEERLENERRAELARKEAEKAARRNKKIAIIVTAIIFVIVAFVIVLITVIIPNNRYNNALALMEAGKYSAAISAFEEIDGYKDSQDKIAECNTMILDGKYNDAVALMNAGEYNNARNAFVALDGYKDSEDKIAECNAMILDGKYNDAVALMNAKKYIEAISAFGIIKDYKDSAQKIKQCQVLQAGVNFDGIWRWVEPTAVNPWDTFIIDISAKTITWKFISPTTEFTKTYTLEVIDSTTIKSTGLRGNGALTLYYQNNKRIRLEYPSSADLPTSNKNYLYLCR